MKFLLSARRAIIALAQMALVLLTGVSSPTLAQTPCAEQVSRPGAATPSQQGGIGGTGMPANEGGVGGTGATSDKGGIGGTGIIGTVTGFASVCVNGLEVHYDAHTPVTVDGAPASAKELAVGQVVAIEAQTTPTGLRARRIAIVHALVGSLTRIDVAGGELTVLGQTVRIGAHTASSDTVSSLRPGENVQVSGLRQNVGEIVASRIDRVSADTASRIIGEATRVSESGFSVGSLRIELPVPLRAAAPREGEEVSVAGRSDGKRLRAERVTRNPAQVFAERVPRLVLEGYVRISADTRQIRIGDVNVIVSGQTGFTGGNAADLRSGERVIVSGAYTADRRLNAERVAFPRSQSRNDGRSGVSPPGRTTGKDGSRNADRREDDSRSGGRAGASASELRQDAGERSRSEDRSTEQRPDAGSSSESSGRDRVEAPRATDRSDVPDQAERVERAAQAERVERPEEPEGVDRPARAERAERPAQRERVERPAQAERVDRPAQPDRIDRPAQPDRIDRPARPERVERPNQPERVDRPPRVDRSNRGR